MACDRVQTLRSLCSLSALLPLVRAGVRRFRTPEAPGAGSALLDHVETAFLHAQLVCGNLPSSKHQYRRSQCHLSCRSALTSHLPVPLTALLRQRRIQLLMQTIKCRCIVGSGNAHCVSHR